MCTRASSITIIRLKFSSDWRCSDADWVGKNWQKNVRRVGVGLVCAFPRPHLLIGSAHKDS